jgi:hypothetical protein
VVVVEDLPELAVELDGDALPEFTGADHAVGLLGDVGRRVEPGQDARTGGSVVVDRLDRSRRLLGISLRRR